MNGSVLYMPMAPSRTPTNLLGLERWRIFGDTPLSVGRHQVRAEFAYDGGGPARARTSPSMWMATRPATAARRAPKRSSTRSSCGP
jgi:hypothetical protein